MKAEGGTCDCRILEHVFEVEENTPPPPAVKKPLKPKPAPTQASAPAPQGTGMTNQTPTPTPEVARANLNGKLAPESVAMPKIATVTTDQSR
jgi:hypothetical protein